MLLNFSYSSDPKAEDRDQLATINGSFQVLRIIYKIHEIYVFFFISWLCWC